MRNPTAHPLYAIWKQMRYRCTRETHPDFARYGGRGIAVCPSWAVSFDAFVADMGERPTPDHQLERKDNKGPYAPHNCVWATRTEQMRNRRTTGFLVFNGERRSVPEWAEIVGIRQDTIYQRIRHGWSAEACLTIPVRRRAA
jgi:hypothetical protein